MKNGANENGSTNEKVVILLPPLDVSCSVTPIEDEVDIIFHYRIDGEKAATTTKCTPDETYLLTKRLAKTFSDKVGFHLDGGNAYFDEDGLLTKCVTINDDMLIEVLTYAQEAASEMGNCKFHAIAMPGIKKMGSFEMQYIRLNLSQFDVE